MSIIAANPCGNDNPVPRELLPARQQALAAPLSLWYRASKATLDFVLALHLFVLSAPVMLAAMLLIKFTSRGPALYSQTRLGKDGQQQQGLFA